MILSSLLLYLSFDSNVNPMKVTSCLFSSASFPCIKPVFGRYQTLIFIYLSDEAGRQVKEKESEREREKEGQREREKAGTATCLNHNIES